MSTEDFQVQDIYRYSRKSFKNNRTNIIQDFSEYGQDNQVDLTDSPRNDYISPEVEAPRCSCDDSEGEIANILHKKCPVIVLAQQQLQRLLNETDRLFCDNNNYRRSMNDFLYFCKEAILKENRCQCALIILAFLSFFIGLLIGASSCGTYLRKFNSPILSCIDNYFISDKHSQDTAFRAIV
ncbi:uncharacterized protein LOC119833584 [Zerene cesonia]|uniref:uncharacterized protein LOC119833584 n=1 Tax=Zerene cesonia TaxID=33412 RepID=UPI0018E501E5|nr:uncharacterized protein LOC119833584 [Zerene cesonia]